MPENSNKLKTFDIKVFGELGSSGYADLD